VLSFTKQHILFKPYGITNMYILIFQNIHILKGFAVTDSNAAIFVVFHFTVLYPPIVYI